VPAPGDAGSYKNLPMPPPPSFNEADVSDKPDYIQALPLLGDRGIKKEKANRRKSYESLIEVDRQVSDVVQALKDKGVYDNTVIVYMTDNGYSFGEHRFNAKTCEYVECGMTPLLIHYPGATPHVEPALASNVDIAPTLAAIGGATPTIAEDGLSLKPFLDGAPPDSWRKGVLIHWVGARRSTGYWGVYTRDYLYTELFSGTIDREVYDLTGKLGPADPDEMQNVAYDPAYAGVRSNLASLLATLKASAT
jgi:arylsulfatase A-like enzyme